MAAPKQTREERKQAVLSYVRSKLSTGLTPAEVRDRLVAKGFTLDVAQKVVVMASTESPAVKSQELLPISTVTTQAGESETVANNDGPASAQDAQLSDFAIHGRLLKLPVVRGECTLPNICVVCGKQAESDAVWKTEKYLFNSTTRAAAFSRGLICALLMFLPDLVSSSRHLDAENAAIDNLAALFRSIGGLFLLTSIILLLRRNARIPLHFPVCKDDMASRQRRIQLTNIAAGLAAAGLIGATAAFLPRDPLSGETSQLALGAVASFPFILLIEWIRLRSLPTFRLATTGKNGIFCAGLTKSYLESVENSGAPKVEPPYPKAFLAKDKPGFPIALFFLTLYVTGAALVVVPLFFNAYKQAAATSSRRNAIVNLSHAAGSGAGHFEEHPLVKVWVPDEWDLTTREIAPYVSTYVLATPLDVVSPAITIIPNERLDPYLHDNQNAASDMEKNFQEKLFEYERSDFKKILIDDTEGIQFVVKGVPRDGTQRLVFVITVSNINEHSYRRILTVTQEAYNCLSSDQLAEFATWFIPAVPEINPPPRPESGE